MATNVTTPPKVSPTNTPGTAAGGKKKRERSPTYPFLSLREAIARVTTLWQHEKRNAIPISVAASHWGYAAKSSGAFQTIATLKQFGLLTDEGSGEKRNVRLSDAALDILRGDENSGERLPFLKLAALKPTIHRELWNRFKNEASDKNIRTYLIFDRKFAETAANSLIKEYRDTIRFAQLSGSDTVEETSVADDRTSDDMSNVIDDPPPPIKQPLTTGAVREFQVPLPSGAVASFKIPFPMSEEDFKQYSALLTAYKSAIVRKEKPEAK